MKIVFATRNAGKARELRLELEGLPITALSQDEAGVEVNIIEGGATYAANALLKAEAVSKATGLPALADDSGIEVEALPGELGVLSARFGGEGLDDTGRNRLLLERLEGVADIRRGARYVCVLAFCRAGREAVFFEGVMSGRVLKAPRGEGGFGYDPIMYLPGRGCSVAELDPETKNRISHRGLALAAFREWIAANLE
ncbi:MAG: RdgB/HAM1 family non-canonical purine NTP pyrophosphatase [Nitrospinota bacterium]|jgi:XTP/dITP diphosphohydrolase|nr:RdgB/HAM1 family non-canonical purine NTP pyrophosphatase [Nitrospinota bacterium]MDP7167064.1 RdgB/HAM1 family non-canonical purine NTP pyrophosphatase [Nitrospinota bacterium]MDP7370053.1 RdgB/HAM1 family non-canonical purine NTP pyrophosphatase [Nitrospinota bacterium]MDP7663984.1 RdgB/HAM1 family non-canonical purine NTP pyrophosphatase [Nitrospinota bacterium]HJP12930.1 RdgB/HAM1 family non-canonical purine NTP pyrophosphatase [Nitrospinota bacterium]